LKVTSEPSWQQSIKKQLSGQEPFSLLPEHLLEQWIAQSKRLVFKPGQRLLRPDELNSNLYLVLKGEVRLIVLGDEVQGEITLGIRGPGQLLGWSGLLRTTPTEFVQARTEVFALALPAVDFISFFETFESFSLYFQNLTSPQEAYAVAIAAVDLEPKRPIEWFKEVLSKVKLARTTSFQQGTPLENLPDIPATWHWYLSTPNVPGVPVGTMLLPKTTSLPVRADLRLPYRAVAFPEVSTASFTALPVSDEIFTAVNIDEPALDLYHLGILEDDHLSDKDRFPELRGRGPLAEATAVIEIVAIQQQVPFRRDAIQKVLEDQFRRDKQLTLELIASLCELLGMSSQLAETATAHFASVETPAIFFIEGIPVVLQAFRHNCFILSHPHHGIQRLPVQYVSDKLGESVKFMLPQRVSSTPTSKFGWGWFTPLLTKYKIPLILVFSTSLLAQLFGLAIPLLLQQIIDKVLTQGNLSSLNVLGSTMIVLALFQGVLQTLRTFIFVDTTDRMDLTLGSSVITRLLSLPLSFFEKRPVGELSQRLGELNTIRNFLTGTALISLLNIIFASVYLIVMFVYSPLLSVVSLSTLPLYLLMVFGVAPIYKSLIRKRAVASARTQSHLIEVIGGIQTVKAQHFELTARWKWQDRYRNFVQEGFKSVALGATAGEIGNFLNQVSGLLVLWVGMWLVLQGNFTLGQLIAFRIISSNVTGPLLQLAGLYQGFQGVQLSMERLSDIIDQNPEFQTNELGSQICLPPIKGKVSFESVKFRFGSVGPFQVDNVSLEVLPGSFVGVVGQSGSGKSTLMKLLPRLYEPSSGKILIDDYDASKVDLSSLRRQIGIVPQDSLLFEGTVAENISLNDPQASTETIIECATLACAHDFIMSLPQGYATQLSERGSNLSGGQRQRLAIARTILSNPQLIILDEATSALDYETEKELCDNLQKWSKGKTVFFITHRLTTIRNCDLILVMHNGRLAEKGTHHELIASNNRYAALYRQQDSLT